MYKNYSFSIVVPVYNTKKEYLIESLTSLLNLKYDNYEIIIIDDGSNNETKNILKSFDDQKIVYIENKNNCGQHISRINGVIKAKGDYVLFVDSDDLLDYESLLTLNKILNNKEYDMLMFGYSRFDNNVNEIKFTHNYFEPGELEKDSVIKELVSFHINGACLKCTKRNLISTKINRYVNTNLREGEDLALSTDLVMNSNSFFYTDKQIYFYRINNNNREYYSFDDIKSTDRILPTYYIVFKDNQYNHLLKYFKEATIKMIIYKILIILKHHNINDAKILLDELLNLECTKIIKDMQAKTKIVYEFLFFLFINKKYGLFILASRFCNL